MAATLIALKIQTVNSMLESVNTFDAALFFGNAVNSRIGRSAASRRTNPILGRKHLLDHRLRKIVRVASTPIVVGSTGGDRCIWNLGLDQTGNASIAAPNEPDSILQSKADKRFPSNIPVARSSISADRDDLNLKVPVKCRKSERRTNPNIPWNNTKTKDLCQTDRKRARRISAELGKGLPLGNAREVLWSL